MINKVFKHIDDLFALGKTLAKNDPHNKGAESYSFNTSEYCLLEDCELCEEDRMIWKYKKPNHNGNVYYFLFRTNNKYHSEVTEKEIMEKSELRKCFYKDVNVEIGISIENTLQPPNSDIWGYTFRGYEYYLIKDGKTTFSKSRAEIRRIYNNKPEWTQQNVRIEYYHSQKTEILEIDNINEIHSYKQYDRIKKVYELETLEGELYFIVSSDSVLKDYACYLIDQDEEQKIAIAGGIEECAKSYVNGESFNIYNWMTFEKLENLINVEEGAEKEINKVEILNISYPFGSLEGYQIFKQI